MVRHDTHLRFSTLRARCYVHGTEYRGARHRQLERKAREDRRKALAAQANISPEEMAAREAEIAAARAKDALAASNPPEPKKEEKVAEEPKKAPAKKAEPKEDTNDDLFAVEEDDDDLF